MERKLRVVLLYGGRSSEHEISIVSAKFILDSLDRERYEPVLIGINKMGRWIIQSETDLIHIPKDPRLVTLGPSLGEVRVQLYSKMSENPFLESLDGKQIPFDVVFPVLHGPMGEDGTIQGLFELAQIPYVGSGVLGSSVGMDKDVMKRLLAHADLPIVPYEVIREDEWVRSRNSVLEKCSSFGFPVFIKPANLGSSVGIRKINTPDYLEDAIEYAFEFDSKIICEQGIASVREIECAVLGNDHPIASIPGEIQVSHPDGFYSYRAKYIDENGASTMIPAVLNSTQKDAVQLLAIQTFKALEASGLARVDFFLSKDNRFFVNEINTMPGFTSISMYPKLWQSSGIDSKQLVHRLIELAIAKHEMRAKFKISVK